MDNSRKHDSIGTKTHRTAPSSETSEHQTASANATSAESSHLPANATAPAVIMASTTSAAHPAASSIATTAYSSAAGSATNEKETQNLSSSSTTAVSATSLANAAATSAPSTTSITTNNSAAAATTALVPKSHYAVTPSQYTQPTTAASSAMGTPSAIGGGGAHSSTSTGSTSQSSTKTVQRPAVFDKLESLVQDMQDKVHGVPVRDQKTFLTSIPFAFMGYDLIEWLMERLTIEDSLEAVHLANLLCQFGYYFPIGELKNLLVKDDSSLYRFQSPYYWPSQSHSPDNIEYAIYLAKRSQQRKKDKHALEDYEIEAYNNLKKILANRWDFVTMQSEEQLRVSKDRKRDDKQIIDSQERAFWRVYRPPPGYTTVVESSPVPTREHRVKARSKTKEHLSEEVKFLREYASMSRSKVSQVLDSLIDYTETFVDFDPILCGVLPSNPWITDDQTYWIHNQPLVETPTEKRVRKWEISLDDLVIDPLGVKELMEYMKKEYSHENLRFWLAVQELRYGPGSEVKIKKKVKEIWDEFLSPGAKSEINIDGRTLEATKLAIKTPSRYTFEVAASHIYMLLLKKDCYPRFIRSENYKTILANAINPGKVKSRIFNFPRVPRRPERRPQGAPATGATGPNTAQGGAKGDYADYGIYGAGQDDTNESPPDGADDSTFSAQNRSNTNAATDSICPWDLDDSAGPPSSKTKDDSTKKIGGVTSGHVRRGSDPTSLSHKTSSHVTTSVTKPRLNHPIPTCTAAAIATSVLPLEAASAIVSSTTKVTPINPTAKNVKAGSTSEFPTSIPTVSTSQPPTLDPKSTELAASNAQPSIGNSSHEKHRHSEGGASATPSSGGKESHHHHHHHHHHHAASKGKSRNRRSKKRITSRASSTAASSSGTNVVDNEIEQAMASLANENATSSTSTKEVKSHNPPTHQHSAASLLTSVASASFAMASIEGLQPSPIPTAITTASSTAPNVSPPSATSGAVASTTLALIPASALGETASQGAAATSSVMETKCTQTKLDKELADFIPPNATHSSPSKPPEATPTTVSVASEGQSVGQGQDVSTANETPKPGLVGTSTGMEQQTGIEAAGSGQPPAVTAEVIGAESKGELSWTRSTTEVCPWEDEDNRKESHAPFVKTYATLGYL